MQQERQGPVFSVLGLLEKGKCLSALLLNITPWLEIREPGELCRAQHTSTAADVAEGLCWPWADWSSCAGWEICSKMCLSSCAQLWSVLCAERSHPVASQAGEAQLGMDKTPLLSPYLMSHLELCNLHGTCPSS